MKSNKGSALLVAILLSAILLAALAGLLTVALNEYRGSHHSYLNTAAFNLAEAGVDIAADAIKNEKLDSATGGWSKDGSVYIKTIKDSENHQFSVFCKKGANTALGEETYDVRTVGSAYNPGGQILAKRAIEASLASKQVSTPGEGFALLAKSELSIGNDTSASQVHPRVASYHGDDATVKSKGTPEWDGANFDKNGRLGVASNQDDILKLNDATLYGELVTGGGANSVFASDATVLLPGTTTSLSYQDQTQQTKINESVKADPTLNNDFSCPKIDGENTPSASWLEVSVAAYKAAYPDQNDPNGKYQTEPKLQQTSNNKVKGASYNSGILTLGDPNYDVVKDTGKNTIILTGSFEKSQYSTVNVYGKVVMVLTDAMNTDEMVINFKTPGSSLEIYTTSSVNGVSASTVVTNSDGATVANFDSSRYKINVLPSAGDWRDSVSTSDTVSTMIDKIAAIAASADAAPSSKSAPGVTLNFNKLNPLNDAFVGTINAPFSTVQLSVSSDGSQRDLFCGQIKGDKISITGGEAVDILYDEDAGGGGTTKPRLAVASWRQILPSSVTAKGW